MQQLDAPSGAVRFQRLRAAGAPVPQTSGPTRDARHPPAADGRPHPPTPPPPAVTARQHQPQHPGPLGGEHQAPPRCQADPSPPGHPLGLGHHPLHGPAAERFLHGPQHVVLSAQPRNDQQLPGFDPETDQTGRVQVVVAGEPEERALPSATAPPGRQGTRQQSRAEPGGGFIPRHFVNAAQAQPASREGPVDPGNTQRQTRLLRRPGFLDSADRAAERFRGVSPGFRHCGHGADSIPKKTRIHNPPPECAAGRRFLLPFACAR